MINEEKVNIKRETPREFHCDSCGKILHPSLWNGWLTMKCRQCKIKYTATLRDENKKCRICGYGTTLEDAAEGIPCICILERMNVDGHDEKMEEFYK